MYKLSHDNKYVGLAIKAMKRGHDIWRTIVEKTQPSTSFISLGFNGGNWLLKWGANRPIYEWGYKWEANRPIYETN